MEMSIPTEFHSWNLLMPEVKLMCVKQMDLIQKLKLRATSKLDNALINIHNFDVDKIEMTDETGTFVDIQINADEKYKLMSEDDRVRDEQLVPFIAFLLKHGVIDKYHSSENEEYTEENLEAFKKCNTIKIKNFVFKGLNAQRLHLLANCARDVVKSVTIESVKDPAIDFDQLMAMTSLDLVKKWQIDTRVQGLNNFQTMAHKWIENDNALETSMELRVRTKTTLQDFATEFHDRIVSQGHREVRISTNNKEKDILLMASQNMSRFHTDEVLFMMVLPKMMNKYDKEYAAYMKENGPNTSSNYWKRYAVVRE